MARRIVSARLDDLARRHIASGLPPLDPQEEAKIAQAVLDALFGLGRIQPYIDDPDVENIDVNGARCVWVTYADGSKEMVGEAAGSDAELIETIRAAAARYGLSERRFDHGHPELDLRLPDGSRLSALMSVTAHPVVSIRRHRFLDLGLGDLVGAGMIDDALCSFLGAAVRAKKNIIVAGAMNSGKTTMIRALSSEIPVHERLVTIEQAFELGLDTMRDRHPDVVALEAREANAEGNGAVTMAQLVRRSLRMNADRVIVGEVLGDEVIPMLNAMSQGRAGSMCTIHADSSSGVFQRIASYAVQAPERLPLEATSLLIAGSIHLVVFIEAVAQVRKGLSGDIAFGVDGSLSWPGSSARPGQPVLPGRLFRVVASVREVVGADGLQVISNEVFQPGPAWRAVAGAPLRSDTLEELVAFGYDPTLARAPTARWQ